MFLLDTNVVSELRRQARAHPRVAAWTKATDVGVLFISAITVFELEWGARLVERRDPKQGAMLREWIETRVLPSFADRILPVDIAVARTCATLHVPDPRPERDAFIAATAIVHRLTVVTRNSADFQPMGVALLDPWQ